MPNFIVNFEEEANVKLVQTGAGLKAPPHFTSTPEKPAINRVKERPHERSFFKVSPSEQIQKGLSTSKILFTSVAFAI